MFTEKLLSVSLIGTEWILILLIVISVISWAIIIERFLFLKQKQGNIDKLKTDIEKIETFRGVTPVVNLLGSDQSSPAFIGKHVLTHAEKGGGPLGEYLGLLLAQEKLVLDSRLMFLGTVVSIAPFVGLLGTVLGIIKAFHGLSLNKQASDLVMAGIAESLIATALGLFIAIPAAVAYNYFLRVIKKNLITSDNFAQYLIVRFGLKTY